MHQGGAAARRLFRRQACRKVQQTIVDGSRSGTAVGFVCRWPDGARRIVP